MATFQVMFQPGDKESSRGLTRWRATLYEPLLLKCVKSYHDVPNPKLLCGDDGFAYFMLQLNKRDDKTLMQACR